MYLLFAVLGTILSAAFFVGNKVLMARHEMPWIEVWRWGLGCTSLCGLIVYVALGMPSLPWMWLISAGLFGSIAHVAANKALSWGDASFLIPISGAKPLLVALLPLVMGATLPSTIIYACLLSTFGIALSVMVPPRAHKHAPHPYWGFMVMWIAVVLMVGSDVCGAKAVETTGSQQRFAIISGWCLCMGIAPLFSLMLLGSNRHRCSWRVRGSAMILGVVFAAFLGCLTVAFALAPNPALAVAEVNIVMAFRGLVSVLMVLALDRWLALALEPLPGWIHAVRLLGSLVLGGAVAIAFM
jgi:drug/metabolite transporter (DMT)-like permease